MGILNFFHARYENLCENVHFILRVTIAKTLSGYSLSGKILRISLLISFSNLHRLREYTSGEVRVCKIMCIMKFLIAGLSFSYSV